ncbi:tetraacyldisaccharide 4'-kinase [Fuerstiella marisgermanici]|nr:tetraacyldisaccharide 4'-kinase [Fuerstiella marisgermanici]
MSEESFKQLISGKSRGVMASVARGMLHCLSMPYSGVMCLRNAAFDIGLKKDTRVAVPVISIGNLTTGGTGKTPIVATVVKLLQELGQRPGIVSRGYRADASGENDEKRVLAQLCPDVSHEQNPDRVAAAQKLIDTASVTAIVLDDAFQHRRIHRDLNIVLIDATNPFGYGHLLPRGLLREPLSGLKRADVVLITRADSASENTLSEIAATVIEQNPSLAQKIFRVSFRPTGLLSNAGARPLSHVEDKPVTVMTAIGNPGAFVNTCRQIGADVVTSMFFPDHHHYTEADLQSARQHAEAAGAPLILTTLKDLVKIPDANDDICAVQIATAFESEKAQQLFRDHLAAAVNEKI